MDYLLGAVATKVAYSLPPCQKLYVRLSQSWHSGRTAFQAPSIHSPFQSRKQIPLSLIPDLWGRALSARSEEHTSELQSLMHISYAVFCLKKKNYKHKRYITTTL